MLKNRFLDKIKDHSAVIGVIGLGYVGLPLIKAFISAGFRVMGFDTSEEKVNSLLNGKSYIRHIPSEWIAEWTATGRFKPTADLERLNEPDAILICVPTPLSASRDPDLVYVENSTRAIARTLRRGQLIVLESTTWPGTTRSVMLPLLEATGMKVGQDFFLAFSPEREDPGNPKFSAAGIPKLVGGIDRDSGDLALMLYSQAVVEAIPVSSCEVAEAAKIVENTYRAVNIALVNELKVIFDRMGIDVWEVIDAARTKPFGFQAFYPGPGLGGHCIPIDPFYLSWVARKHGVATQFIELAGQINTRMPEYVIQHVLEGLNEQKKPVKGSRICVLGIAYKKDVDDPRESPAFELISRLIELGAKVSYNDPLIASLPKMRSWPHIPPMKSQKLTDSFLARQDCVLIATDHTAYDYDEIVNNSALVIDTRNATKNVRRHRDRIRKA
ncbi:MAG: nucleotide sugar dehydrogenase [Planctomycetia bacterium]|nr:nucleotide sugar dehydrogenase [Planctomycetia bacterium]